MTSLSPSDDNNLKDANNKASDETEDETILCPHCLRTATNGIKCKGMCVADSDY